MKKRTMKRMTKRFTSLLLVMMLLFGTLPASAFATEAENPLTAAEEDTALASGTDTEAAEELSAEGQELQILQDGQDKPAAAEPQGDTETYAADDTNEWETVYDDFGSQDTVSIDPEPARLEGGYMYT